MRLITGSTTGIRTESVMMSLASESRAMYSSSDSVYAARWSDEEGLCMEKLTWIRKSADQ